MQPTVLNTVEAGSGLTTRVLLFDHDQILLHSLEEVLNHEGFQVCGVEVDHDTAILKVRELCPQVVIVGLFAPVRRCLEAAREMRRISPRTQVVARTDNDEAQSILDAVKVGIRGYVLRSQSVEDLMHAVHDVAGGGAYLSSNAWSAVVKAYVSTSDAPAPALSPREYQVLRLIADGRTTRQIADALHLSAKTIEFHRTRTMGKLNIHTAAGLIRHAIRRGLVSA